MNPQESELPGSDVRDKAANLPDEPGVYLFKNSRGEILYVGKAKSLKRRVRSYLSLTRDVKTRHLQSRIADLECFVTRSEGEALLLENNLIKQWKPKYNINLKDGKTYPVIKLTTEEYPRVYRTRRILFDGSRYFGPFPQVNQIDLYLNLVDRLFPLRKCRGPVKTKHSPAFTTTSAAAQGCAQAGSAGRNTGSGSRRCACCCPAGPRGCSGSCARRCGRPRAPRPTRSGGLPRSDRGHRDPIGRTEGRGFPERIAGLPRLLDRRFPGPESRYFRCGAANWSAGTPFLLENYTPSEDVLPVFLGQYYGSKATLPPVGVPPSRPRPPPSGAGIRRGTRPDSPSEATPASPRRVCGLRRRGPHPPGSRTCSGS